MTPGRWLIALQTRERHKLQDHGSNRASPNPDLWEGSHLRRSNISDLNQNHRRLPKTRMLPNVTKQNYTFYVAILSQVNQRHCMLPDIDRCYQTIPS